MDDDGEVAQGEEGELCVRGPQVMQGYWNRPDATDKIITHGGWLHTGDIARMDENGYFYLIDRKKNMIVVSGFNVYPTEIEKKSFPKCQKLMKWLLSVWLMKKRVNGSSFSW